MKFEKAYFNINKKYNGEHPIEEHQHYENLIQSRDGLEEVAVVGWAIENGMVVVEYIFQ